MQKKEYSIEIGGKTLTAIFTDLADQAHGSVMLKYGETIVLATACMSKDKQQGLGFFNLTVDYMEKFWDRALRAGKASLPTKRFWQAGQLIGRSARFLTRA